MKRIFATLVLGLALVLPLVGCTSDKAPDVTPTPTPAVTSTPDMPKETVRPTKAPGGGDGIVGDVTDGVGDVAGGVGDAAKDMIDGVGDAAKDIGDGVKRAMQ